MRAGLLLYVLLLAPPAFAADDAVTASSGPSRDEMSQMNAATQAWDRYVALSRKDDPAAIDQLATSSLRHFGFLRDVARFGSPGQIRRVPLSDRALVYCLRSSQDDAQLAALDDAGVARLAFGRGWAGVAKRDDGVVPRLSHVTLLAAGTAIGELAPPTGTQFQFGPELALEQGRWKVVSQTLVADESAYIQQMIQQSGVTETRMLQTVVAGLLERRDELPNLAMLDQPLRDDAAMRTRLNEIWPDYQATYKTRVRAVEKKADEGDSLAQLAYGAMLYSGEAPQLVAQDKPRGLALLEKASDSGSIKAAMVVAGELLQGDDLPEDKPLPPERIKRALPHVRRAAEGGEPIAMAALGGFYFNGAAGLARDCRQAEEWQAKAEDAGHEMARNNRVWSLAVCPIPDQRDPARALELAAAMIDKADALDSAELDTIAAAFAANGRFAEAADYQQRAITKLAKDEAVTRRRMKDRLQTYQGRHDWTQSYNAFEMSE